MTDTVAWQSMLNQVREERDRLRAQLSAAMAERDGYKDDALRLHKDKMDYRDALAEIASYEGPDSAFDINAAQMRATARAALEPKP
jgi:hypothetical protein